MKLDFAGAARRIAAECTCRRARQVARALTKHYDQALRPIGLQISQMTVLVAVAMSGKAGAGIGTLAEALGMDRTTFTRNLRPLEKAGLLQVARFAEDARARRVSLTRRGQRAIEDSFPPWERAQRQVRGLLGAGWLDDLHGRLARTARAVSGQGKASPAPRSRKPRRKGRRE